MKTSKELNLVIIGLGYVGLPLAIAFANKRPVKGFLESVGCRAPIARGPCICQKGLTRRIVEDWLVLG